MPAASMAASVSGAGRARGRRRGGRPTPSSVGGRPSGAVRLHASSVASQTEMDALSRIDPFGARAPLGPGLPDLLPRVGAGRRRPAARPCPSRSGSCSRTCSATPAAASSSRPTSRRSPSWRPGVAAEAEIPFMPSRVILQDLTGVPAVVDLAVMRDAMADLGGDPAQGQPAGPGRPRHRPLGPGRPVRDERRVRLQRRARVRAQRRALPAAALGADGVPQPAHRPAGHRHRPPGQPRVPGPGRRRPRRRRLPGHARRHRLAHDDDQRARRARLRRRRHRGRGRPARPAALPADAPRRRRPPGRRAAEGLHRDRPRARRDRDAAAATASSARSSSSPATAWPACRSPTARRSAT